MLVHRFCPPPPICPPPPPPPMPCPPPPPPMPRPSCPCMMQRPSFYPSYVPQYYQPMMPQPMPTAGGCGGGAVVPSVRIPAQVGRFLKEPLRKYHFRTIVAVAAHRHASTKVWDAPHLQPKQSTLRVTVPNWKTLSLMWVHSFCTSSLLSFQNISEDASESKRNIQKIAEETLGHEVNVICGTGEFSYIAHTDTFCQAFKEDVTCYAFKPLQ